MKYLLAAISALLLSNAAAACSCFQLSETGFVHANLQHMPANARGALFLTEGVKLKPASFLIMSDQEPGPLTATLSWPDLSGKGKRQRYLARVAPAKGFKIGAHYTIRYKSGNKDWRYAAQTDFFIDAAPLNVADVGHQLVLDGAPARQLLAQSTTSGMCSSQQPATVQNFHYELPAAYLPYRSAIYYATRAEGAEPYFDSLCGSPGFGTNALGDNRDIVHSSCAAPQGKLAIQGWAALLEVEDRPHPTNTIHADLSAAQGQSCTAFGILKEALAAHDNRRVTSAVCRIAGVEYWDKNSGIPEDMPTPQAMLALSQANASTPRECVQQAITTVLTHSPEPANDLAGGLGQMIAGDLASADAQIVDQAIMQLSASATYIAVNSSAREDYQQARLQALIEPTLPILVHMLAARQPQPIPTFRTDRLFNPPGVASFGRLIGYAGDKANAYLPDLLAAAESTPEVAEDAMRALEAIAPKDPRVQALRHTIMPSPNK